MRKNVAYILLVVWLFVSLCHIQHARAQLFGGKLRDPSPFDPSGIPTGSGSFLGRTCFDIAESNDDINECGSLSGRISNRNDFNVSGTRTQVYTFTPSGTVSNVRFYYINTNGEVITSVSGGNPGNNITTPQTATFYYNQDLSSDNPGSAPYNGLAYGRTSDNPLTAELFVVYNNGATGGGTDRQLKISCYVKDCSCCGVYVASGVYKEFHCYNLGSYSQTGDPLMPQWQNNGGYFQWGRKPNCGQCWGVTANSAYWLTGGSTSQIVGAAGPSSGSSGGENADPVTNWYTTNAPDGSWVDASKTTNDPCPEGYRVPTYSNWYGVINNNGSPAKIGSWLPSNTNYTSGVKFGPYFMLPAAGARDEYSGYLWDRGNCGYYWTSTERFSPTDAWYYIVYWYAWDNIVSTTRRNGYSVRCISE